MAKYWENLTEQEKLEILNKMKKQMEEDNRLNE